MRNHFRIPATLAGILIGTALFVGTVFGAVQEGRMQSETSVKKSNLEQRRQSLVHEYQTLQQQMAEGQANLLRIEGAIRIIDLTLEDNKTTTTDSVSTDTVKRN